MNKVKKTNSSIVFKLNTWFFTHVVFRLLFFDLIIILLFTGVLFYNSEKVLVNSTNNKDWQAEVFEGSPNGVEIPRFIKGLFPEFMRDNIRQIKKSTLQGGFWEQVRGTQYRVWIPVGDMYKAKDYPMGQDIVLFTRLFIVLMIFEVLSVFLTLLKGARAVRKALKPIDILTETARSINNTPGITQNSLRDLTGKIDKINAEKLDTRLSVSSSQRELKELAGAINGMLDRINESYRSQIRFVSDASHELRTPIAVIQGYANLLDRWGKKIGRAHV